MRKRVVGVVAHLGWQVEGDREASGSGSQQFPVAGIGFGGSAKAGVLTHGPRAGGVHRGMNSAGVRIGARLPELGRQRRAEVSRPVDRLERQSGLGPTPC